MALMNSRGAGLIGAQRPRILHRPEYVSSTGGEAVELAAMAGLELDEWQQLVLTDALGERADGSWAAFEVGVEVPRQNGKGGLLEARELAGLFLLGEQLMVHSAHEFSTAEEALERMAIIIESCAEFSRRVKVIKRSHGQEGIYLTNGQRLRYRTRTKGGGRGLSADLIVLDEAMHIPEAMLNALFPTLSARKNPQLWYTGSAVDQETMDNGVVFARLRERALEGSDPSLAYFGWSPNIEHPDSLTAEQANDPAVWAQANPALGIRITEGYVAAEQRSMSARGFAVERLGVGDWPATDSLGARVISDSQWLALCDRRSVMLDPVCFAFDVTPDRSMAAIGVAGRREDGRIHVEVIAHERGTSWLARRLDELLAAHENVGVVADLSGPAGSMLPAMTLQGIEIQSVSANEHAKASGMFYDAAAEQDSLRHLGSRELAAAVAGAKTRPLGEAWAWSRKSSAVDISPLVACTLAFWGAALSESADTEFMFEVFA
jgi:hypothetical protein